MNALIVAAGRFDEQLQQRIADGREPRLDMFALRDRLGGRLLDSRSLDHAPAAIRAVQRVAGDSAALALLALHVRGSADALFTSGEDIGIPLALALAARRVQASHTMIAHTLAPRKKRPFFHLMKAHRRMDRILCYASREERLMIDTLHIPARQVVRIAYHADERFFRPLPEIAVEPDLVCSAGQLLRDYDTLIRATEGQGLRVHIAAGSPWIASPLSPTGALPAHVDWRRYDRFELRALYARSAIAVVALKDNDYQTGISTILEMMAMGKCVVVTRTRGQTDTIVDGENGLYVPPGDVAALRAVLSRLRANPEEAARLGASARRYVEEKAGFDLFVRRVAEEMEAGHRARFPGAAS